MAENKSITDELTEYNKELEKHMSSIDLSDSLSKMNLFEDSSSDDLLPLISSGILDVKTSMDLMRRDLINNVENILVKAMQENQRNFFKKMDLFSNNMFIKLKGIFSTHVTDLYNELSDVKSNSKRLELSMNEIRESMNDFNGSLYELKETLGSIEDIKSDVGKITTVEKNIENIDSNFEEQSKTTRLLVDSLGSIKELLLRNESDKSVMSNEISKFSSKINHIETNIEDFEGKVLSIKENLNLDNMEKKIDNIELSIEDFENKVLNIKEDLDLNNMQKKTINSELSGVLSKINKVENNLQGMKSKHKEDSNNIKVITKQVNRFDSKLEKVNFKFKENIKVNKTNTIVSDDNAQYENKRKEINKVEDSKAESDVKKVVDSFREKFLNKSSSIKPNEKIINSNNVLTNEKESSISNSISQKKKDLDRKILSMKI